VVNRDLLIISRGARHDDQMDQNESQGASIL
jgi:hypothetical protein